MSRPQPGGGRGAAILRKLEESRKNRQAEEGLRNRQAEEGGDVNHDPPLQRETMVARMRARRQAQAAAVAAEAMPQQPDDTGDPSISSFTTKHEDFVAHKDIHDKLKKAWVDQASTVIVQEDDTGRAKGSGVAPGTKSKQLDSDSSTPTTRSPHGSSGYRSTSPGNEGDNVESRKSLEMSGQDKQKGTSGEKLCLETNWLKLKTSSGNWYDYHVTFDPHLESKGARIACLAKLREELGRARTFDGAKLCMPKNFGEVRQFESSYLPHFPSVKVTITMAAVRAMHDANSVHMYNILFNRVMRQLKYVRWNRNHYDPVASNVLPHLKLEVWPGYVTAVQEQEGGVMLNCDVSSRVLRQETVYSVIKDILLIGDHDHGTKDQIKKKLLGCSVLTRYNNKHYRIDDIDFDNNPTKTFVNSAGQEMKLEDYYRQHYDIQIKDLRQPLLVSRPKRLPLGAAEHMVYLIPELCHLTGIDDDMRRNHSKMKELYNVIKSSPQQRALAVKNFVSRVKTSPECREILTEWGLELDDAAISVDGRGLQKFKLLFGNSKSVPIRDEFSEAFKRNEMLSSCPLENWVIVADNRDRSAVNNFVRLFTQASKHLGMMVGKPEMLFVKSDRVQEYIGAIKSAAQSQTPDMVVVFLAQKRADKYSAIKKLCYVELGLSCQVLQPKTLSNQHRAPAIVQKIGMQINAKLGGEVWGIKSPYSNAMVVGIDVYHDPANESNSWCGLVASLNTYFTRWASFSEKHSNPKEEMSPQLAKMFQKALRQYYKFNEALPDRIVIYRDGVGDGRFDFTKEFEMPQVKAAFKEFEDFSPPITLVIVSKRIQTRLFAKDEDSGYVSNPPPGTVLDHTITKRKYNNFFLVSQKVNQGTVTPTHYISLVDEIGMGLDKIQKLTYRLCYMYFNWTGPVRVPAPCLYAHKIAGMAGEYLKKSPDRMNPDLLFYI